MTNKTTPDDDWLDQPVTIHFKEDSIPGLRRGKLTDEAKKALQAHIHNAVLEGRIKGAEKLVEALMKFDVKPAINSPYANQEYKTAWMLVEGAIKRRLKKLKALNLGEDK